MATTAPLQVGDPAPDIRLPTADDRRWDLREHRGRPVVLIFHRHLH
ncbi:hypothetical protein [Actinospongicola halichondriae]